VRLHQTKLSDRFSSSGAEWDHHAFLWWPAAQLAVLPVDSETFHGAAGYRVDRQLGITGAGRVTHPGGTRDWTPPVDRAVVVGARLFTISALGVKASDLQSFADVGWVAFPQPPPDGEPVAGD
jgi:beta propeller domain-containing protein